MSHMTHPLVNGHIKAEQVQIIDEAGKGLGVFALGDALKLAQDRGEDLIQLEAEGETPLCQILDYGRYQWRIQQAQKDGGHD